MRPRRRALVLALLGLATALFSARPAGAEDWETIAKTVRDDLKSDRPETRLRAFSIAGNARNPKAVELLMTAVVDTVRRRAEIAKAQTEAQTALEKVLAEIDKANDLPATTPKDIAKYNTRMRRLQAERQAITNNQMKLAVEGMQSSAEIEAGLASLGVLIRSLSAEDAEAAVKRLEGAWFTKVAEERERYLTVIAMVPTVPRARERLKSVTGDPTELALLRALAVRGRGQPGDVDALPDLVALLDAPLDQWPTIEAAIDALRRMHQHGAIDPLIRFLGRKETGKLKRVAWRALKSLTGQAHGPFEEPWRDWWKDAERKFFMPDKPVDTVAQEGPEQGATFFGEPLASDRVVFVLDISKSMTELAHPGAAGARGTERRIDLLRREFASAMDQLGENGVFNIVLFGSGIVLFSADGVVPDAAAKARAKKFLDDAEPTGGTNIHDALEAAFRFATPKYPGERALYDTIVFLTDGTPTSGKVTTPEGILSAVRRWNFADVIALRVFGIGECDEDFLRPLAKQNKGTFNKR
jgi:hypothetical protein